MLSIGKCDHVYGPENGSALKLFIACNHCFAYCHQFIVSAENYVPHPSRVLSINYDNEDKNILYYYVLLPLVLHSYRNQNINSAL